MAAGRATDVDRETGIWQKTSLQNRGVLDMHIEVPEGTTPEQIEEAKRQYRDKHGGPDTAREPIFSSGRITQLGQTAVEMDFVASRRAIWTEIAAGFGVPLAAMGFTEDVNLANADAMMRQLWENTIIPQLDLIKRQLNHQLASEFGDDIRLMYDLSNVPALQEDYSEKLANAERLMRLGYGRDEINQKLELGFDMPEMNDEDGEVLPLTDVQDTALNGAQIASLMNIVQAVATGDLPLDSAAKLIAASFPSLGEDEARSMLQAADGWGASNMSPSEERAMIHRLMYG